VTVAATVAPGAVPPATGRFVRARTGPWLAVLAQLGALLALLGLFEIETPFFMRLAAFAFVGAAVVPWIAPAAREAFTVAWSLAGAVLLLGPLLTALLLAAGLPLFAIVRLRAPWPVRIALAVLWGLGLTALRSTGLPGVPAAFWPLCGAIFMFRAIVYLYDARFAKAPPGLLQFLGYFYLLPNLYFLLFPVVDHQTYLVSRQRRPIEECAQTGVRWIARGVLQLVLYRIVDAWRPDPATATGVASVAAYAVLTYLLYLRVSGQFHVAIGMLRLYGLDLPETHRRYLLASSVADFWRRINIYWKDFILKLFYLPVFFRLRRSGEARAAAIATVVAFAATWVLHSYQWYWLVGAPLLSWPDTLFWAILGAVMVHATVRETTARGRRPQPTPLRRAAGIAGTFAFIVLLWSLWNAPSVEAWIHLLSLRGGV
jgi:alginate O-acetyltransferase complex protein AlgI